MNLAGLFAVTSVRVALAPGAPPLMENLFALPVYRSFPSASFPVASERLTVRPDKVMFPVSLTSKLAALSSDAVFPVIAPVKISILVAGAGELDRSNGVVPVVQIATLAAPVTVIVVSRNPLSPVD